MKFRAKVLAVLTLVSTMGGIGGSYSAVAQLVDDGGRAVLESTGIEVETRTGRDILDAIAVGNAVGAPGELHLEPEQERLLRETAGQDRVDATATLATIPFASGDVGTVASRSRQVMYIDGAPIALDSAVTLDGAQHVTWSDASGVLVEGVIRPSVHGTHVVEATSRWGKSSTSSVSAGPCETVNEEVCIGVYAVVTSVCGTPPDPSDPICVYLVAQANAMARECIMAVILCFFPNAGGDAVVIEDNLLNVTCTSTDACRAEARAITVVDNRADVATLWEMYPDHYTAISPVSHAHQVTIDGVSPHPTIPNAWEGQFYDLLWHSDLRCSSAVHINVTAGGPPAAGAATKSKGSSNYCTP